MPDYEEAAYKAGWKQDGTKWTHKAKPGVVERHAIEVWNKHLGDEHKRPTTIDPRKAPVSDAVKESKVGAVVGPVDKPKKDKERPTEWR